MTPRSPIDHGPARAGPRPQPSAGRSALTDIAPNKILIRGYPLDEMMGRLWFADAVYLLLMGELPTPAIGRMLNAVLVSSIDHGVTPPSTLAARNVATSGAPLKDCVAAGILALRAASRRRHRVVHAVSRRRADADARRQDACRRRRTRSSTSASTAERGAAGIRPPLPHARSARRRGCSRWRSSSSSKASTSG